MRRSLSAATLLAALLTAPPVAADPEPAYVDSVLALVGANKLADSKGWHRLGHYRKGLFGGITSEADAAAFFAAKDGRTDPHAELEATVRGFFAAPEGAKDHALCRFPARFLWLSEAIAIDRAKLPAVTCPKLEEFWKRVNVRSLTVVFSSYYLNNPSSAFGHTFLRLNKAPETASPERRALLDNGVDYSANVPDKENAIAYTFRGLFGLYPGTFRMLPYYYKVREYNDFESRDLWEYELDLPRSEVEKVAAHVWELGHSYFDYFYLSENCSYHVLAALEVANPRYDLVDRVRAPVIPVDTVKALMAEPGLVHAVHYRPSARAIFRDRLRGLRGAEIDLVAALVDDPSAAFPPDAAPERVAAIIDAALDFIDVRYAKDLIDDRASRGATLKQKLLERRAELGIASEDVVLAAPRDQMVHRGHASSRLALGMGVTDGSSGFVDLRWRIALHDLADSPIGYPEYAQIEFFPTTVRYRMPERRVELEDLSLVRIASISPMGRFDYKPSWKLRVGATRLRDGGCPSCVMGVTEGGSGVATNLAGEAVTAFATADVSLYAPRFSGDGPRARLAVGPSVGLRIKLASRLVSLTTAAWAYEPWQEPRTTWSAATTLRWQYAQDWAANVEARKQPLGAEAVVSTMFFY